jgi:hypothetical protein
MRLVSFSIAIAIAACGGAVQDKPDAAINPDVDAGIDAPVEPAPRVPPGRELASAAGRLTGGTWTVDIQLGSLASQSNTSGGSWTVRGGAPLHK